MPYQDGIKKPGARLTSLFADISSAKVEWRPFAASLGSMPNGRPRQTLRLPFLAGTALPLRFQYCVDRKSTRLNSSHLVISYAVFCLKKKKHQYTTHHCLRTNRRAR